MNTVSSLTKLSEAKNKLVVEVERFMDIKVLQKRAMEIRRRYDKLGKKKGQKPWTLGNVAQGFVGDVGDLMKLVMAKEGIREVENVDAKLEHEFSDCLYSVLVLSEKLGIDIEKAFTKTMDELEAKIAREED